MANEDFIREVEMKGLTLGAELGPEVVKRELKEVKDPRLNLPRPADCEHCTYRVIAIRHLDEEK